MPAVVGFWGTGSYSRQYNRDGVDPVRTLRVMHKRTGGRLITMTGGEYRREEEDWIIPLCNAIHDALGLPTFGDPNRRTYLRYMLQVSISLPFYPRAVRRIRASRLPQFNLDRFARDDRQRIREVDADVRPMRGIPSPLAIKTFSGLPFGQLRAFEARVRECIDRILADDPETVLQFEIPVELAYGSLPGLSGRRRQRLLTALLRSFVRLIDGTPPGTAYAFHLCWGDLNNKPFVPRSLQKSITKVQLINAILELEVWRFNGGEYELMAIHDPQCDGVNPPQLGEKDWASYQSLTPFPSTTVYAVGVLQEQGDEAAVRALVQRFGSHLDGKVQRMALATPCGNQRMDDAVVDRLYAIGREVLAKSGV